MTEEQINAEVDALARSLVGLADTPQTRGLIRQSVEELVARAFPGTDVDIDTGFSCGRAYVVVRNSSTTQDRFYQETP